MPTLVNISPQKPSEWEDFTSRLDGNKKEQTINPKLSASTRKQELVYNTRKLLQLHEGVFTKKQINMAKASNISILNIFADNGSLKYSPCSFCCWKMMTVARKWQKRNFCFGTDLGNSPSATTKIRKKT